MKRTVFAIIVVGLLASSARAQAPSPASPPEASPPPPEAIAPPAGRKDEYVALGQLVELAEGHGFALAAAHEASLDEWDAFESGFTAGYADWLAPHAPDHPEAAEVRGLAERQHAAYFCGYRGILGLAYLELVAV